LRASYSRALRRIDLEMSSSAESATITAARTELRDGLRGLLGIEPTVTARTAKIRGSLPPDSFSLTALEGGEAVSIRGGDDIGVLYGVFDLLRRVQTRQSLDKLNVSSVPKVQRRLLNHWDNLNRTVERGYAGFSLWEWFYLPEIRSPRYRDYARACASLGVNGSVITNVNADAMVLTPAYLSKVAALAEEFRPYGVRVYLTARFSAPIEIGGLKTADPLDPAVAAWWKAKFTRRFRTSADFS
jgi:alpha-glucuronidase